MRLLALGQLALGLLLGVALAQRDLPLDGADLADVLEQRLLVHLGPAERVVAEDHDVDEARLQGRPLLGALLGRVGLGGDLVAVLAAGEARLRLLPMTATR
jgi:hypothetical protein